MILLVAIAACAYVARTYALPSIAAAVALSAAWAFRMVPKFNHPGWPVDARRLLVIGNLALGVGAFAFTFATAIGLA
jgi:hypothetical protein